MSTNPVSVADLCVGQDAPIMEALKRLNITALGTLFVVGRDGALAGIVTDGDIRRGLIAGAAMDSPVGGVAETGVVSFPATASFDRVVSHLSEKIRVIPLLDEKRRPVDFASLICDRRIPVLEPDLEGNELNYVVECVRTGWVSSKGRFVGRFEEMFADYVGTRHAVSTSSGTTALHLALAALGIGPGDEVIIPDLTFAATINAVIYTGATPVLVDVDPLSWNMEPEQAAEAITPRTRAIMPVHLYGQPAEIDGFAALAERHGLYLIEDAAESLGATYGGRQTGGFGTAGCFSFFGNKLITTGEGGMVVTDDDSLAERLRVLRDHGMDPDRRYWHRDVGFNYRMTNLQAAIGVAQMERIGELLAAKRRIAATYRDILGDVPSLRLPAEIDGRDSSYWIFSVLLDPEATGVERDDLMRRLALQGIETRPVFYPLHEMPPYRRYARNHAFPIAERLAANGISLPSAARLETDLVQRVARALRGAVENAPAMRHMA